MHEEIIDGPAPVNLPMALRLRHTGRQFAVFHG
jgi:hypothetical protein